MLTQGGTPMPEKLRVGMGGFLSVARIQATAEPSNSQNMWTANFCGTDVNSMLKSMLPYQWVCCLIGTIIAAALYF